ncbi:MAG: ParB N-terminal domain-containing protein [Myxococcota bacterium]
MTLDVMSLKVHPVADMFPMLSDKELGELAASIQVNGLLEPVVQHEGQLVDGRNRRKACQIAGVEPDVVDYTGDAEGLTSWIVGKNLHRRHLTPSQKSMIAARIASLPQGHRPVGPRVRIPTQKQAAGMVGASARSVRRARQVLDSGDEALIAQVDAGEVAVSTAAAQVKPTASTQGRAEFDAYYTPQLHADACVRWLGERFKSPRRVLEPAVGDGAWARAARERWPDARIYGLDVDAGARGLNDSALTKSMCGDFMALHGEDPAERHYDFIIGNPPYKPDLLLPWLARSLKMGHVVAYLLRETITGTDTRLSWWREHRPAYICKVVPRPKWEGPGARPTSDFADSVLIVWTSKPTEVTRWDWIDAGRPR